MYKCLIIRDKEGISMKKSMIIKSLLGIAVVIVVVLIINMMLNNKETTARQDAADAWKTLLEKQQFADIPSLVTNASITDNDFTEESLVEKYNTIFKGIGAKDIKIANMKVEELKKDHYMMTYTMTLETALGKMASMNYSAPLVENDGNYKIKWNPTLIFPHMQSTDKISYTIDRAERGQIVDQDDQPLATNAPFYQMGILPSGLGEGKTRDKNLKAISKAFDVSVETLEKKLAQSWVRDNLFVPIKVIDMKEAKDLDGVKYSSKDMRYYPLGEAAAHLIGYTGTVTDEDLKKNKALNPDDTIGKSGLEKTFDKELRGVDGGQISLVTSSGRVRDVLLNAERTDGQTIYLTINSKTQKAAFKALEDATGSSVVINPKTGDLNALVSKPSYDPNKMVRGISQEDYAEYADDENMPFLTRFAQRYAPGSTLKTVTAAVGLDNGTMTETKTHKIKGLKWQESSEWGSYYVTRLHDDVSNVDYKSALIYSDNIFFAKEGLEMGEKKLREGFNKFAFGKDFNLPISMKAAQISNEKTFNSDILLADTAYGQGQVLMSPIQQAVSYTAFANDGKMTYPRLVKGTKVKMTQAVSAESAHKVRAAMQQVIKHKGGTGNTLKSLPYNLAAKTGTAEIKQKQGVYDGTENSFVLVFNADKEDYLLLTIVEDHKKTGRSAIELSKSLIPVLEK